MLPLSKYLNKQFTAGGTVSRKLLIFDVDDTLIHTSARIGIVKDGEITKYISNQEYNDYRLKPGESFDYSEFNDTDILSHESFTKYWKTLKREYARGTHISIITARSIGPQIREFFLKHGIDIKRELVFAVGDKHYPFPGSIQERKAKTIELLHRIGYNTFVFFDDNEGNLESAKQLERKFDIKIHTVKT